MIPLFFILAVAIGTGAILTPLVIRFAVAWGLYDAPHGDRRVHTEPLPRLGGVAVFASVIVSLLAMAVASVVGVRLVSASPGFFYGVLFGGGIIFATGLIDDLRGLRPMSKFAAQIAVALVVSHFGFRINAVDFGSGVVSLGLFSLPVTVLWIVGVTNAFNLIDGLDGLATGIAIVALAMTLTVSVVLGNAEVIFLCVALLGALVAFLRYNFSPARIFLGDSGSLFIGFMLAVLSVFGSQTSSGVVLMLVPLFALAIPLIDTTLAILRRWLRGRPLSEADGRHIHHRLLALGLSHRGAVIVLYTAAALLAVLGLSLVLAPSPAIFSIGVAGGGGMLVLLFFGMRRLRYHEFVEAGMVLTTALGQARRVIRGRIYAQDVAEMIRRAESREQLVGILEGNASTFDYLRMELCVDGATGPWPLVLANGRATRAWKIDFPVTPHDFAGGEEHILRIWCNPRAEFGPQGAERVGHVLAPAIEEWLMARRQSEAVVEAERLANVGPRK
jgi:UDP-GlcNAc:undecaprenyl-phosphate GlcNAc-1-phosphate transferase